MKSLYDFITSLCKDRDMKIEELQKKAGFSRTTLYRYMRGINQITPEVEQKLVDALNLDTAEALEFSKLASLSAFDQSLIESRYVLDDFLFAKEPKRKEIVDIDMVFYNNDRYLRTLREILDYILAYGSKEELKGNIKIVNCLDDNVFLHIANFLQEICTKELNVEAEHFVSLVEKDYLQNTFSFINVFPLIKYEAYRLYYNANEVGEVLMNDSILMSFQYKENGETVKQYFALAFYESGMPECLAFSDAYIYGFQAKNYSNLKHSFNNVVQKCNSFDFDDDIFLKMTEMKSYCFIKPNPCFDKIPYQAFESLKNRMSEEELISFLSALYGQKLSPEAMPHVLEKALQYIKRRLEATYGCKLIDVYSAEGLLEFAETGKLTDHLAYMPAFNQEEIKMTLEYLRNRNNDPQDDYKLYVTGEELRRKDLIIIALKDYGLLIEYVYPEYREELWKLLFVRSKRLASIFCDYVENHIPVSQAMTKEEADAFMEKLIDNLSRG